MSYTKKVAVLKGLKGGFSADGGQLSGIVKAEKYSSFLKVEISLINFATLTEGRYVAAITDGTYTEIIENCAFEGVSPVDTGAGFAAAVCYVNGSVQLIASAVCGNLSAATMQLKAEIEKEENIKTQEPPKVSSDAAAEEIIVEEIIVEEIAPKSEDGVEKIAVEVYEDEAIAEVNYYELTTSDKDGGALCEDTQKEEDGLQPCKDEEPSYYSKEEPRQIELARGAFYEKMRAEIEGLLSAYPAAEELCAAIEGSRWVKIDYGEGKFYVFGVIFADAIPRYICYGLPAENAATPPDSMKGLASLLEVKTQHGCGYWVMYQDADTGASVGVSVN